ncbi:glycosyltransferase family 4 protein [Aureliella helgolandensis]|uniref:GDP-mannose-dependent alpha-(1-6)-phosphatidylinositol monomannoside mannosyltransferase n=1 Tax=Aureliella helgolandensis TaxID=2527968 RepID=A0A518G4G2_9BACT|nr:glycosyltransferase family 4 protein [Aureliella helgolandensis]QDV23487.1 GDP-mannose-dependent alpha-(1-6)-phosphatidylinositol monomannoside mannosyltransferase [Aureliella helgolandensis]
MKIAICSTYVPFIYGGARNIVDWLGSMLREMGHQVEIVYLPEVDSPDTLFHQMCSFRWLRLESADRIICTRPQSHVIPHPCKILWFIHHIRCFYDLWGHPEYANLPDSAQLRGFRKSLFEIDTAALKEAKAVYTNSKVVSKRVKDFNGVDSEVLYPPVYQPERYTKLGTNDEVVCICRMESHKRQALLVEAMAHVTTPVRLRLCGASSGRYAKTLRRTAKMHRVEQKVIIDSRWIAEEEKVKIFGECLASAYLPADEDSYGYPTIEAALSSKPTLSTFDSGGVLEFVEDGKNGYITPPNPKDLARAIDQLYEDRSKTEEMGQAANRAVADNNITWEFVLEKLLS